MSKDSLDTIYDKKIDFKNRVIYIYGPIKKSTLLKLDARLTSLENMRPNVPITIKLDTPGGDVLAALGMVDRIRQSACEVTIIAMSECMSAGISILAAGDVRKSYANTSFMHHPCIYSLDEDSHIIQKHEVDYTEKLEARRMKLIAECTNTKASRWKKLATTKNYYFFPEKAKELGLIQEIIECKI